MKTLIVLALAGVLAACETVRDVPVYVQVPVECRQAVPDRPIMATEQLPARVKIDPWIAAAQAEIETREGYETQLRAGLIACTAPLPDTKH